MSAIDSPSISSWKKLAIRAFFGGVGFAVALAMIAGAALWYHDRPERPKPWNATALKATYDTLEFRVGSSKDIDSYPVTFYYKVQNNTDRNYQINASALTPMAVLTDGMRFQKSSATTSPATQQLMDRLLFRREEPRESRSEFPMCTRMNLRPLTRLMPRSSIRI
jgi:hypothetical protein